MGKILTLAAWMKGAAFAAPFLLLLGLCAATAADDPQEAKLLQFRLIDKDNDEHVKQNLAAPSFIPPGYEKMELVDFRKGKETHTTYFVKITPEIDGSYVAAAGVATCENGGTEVSLKFNQEGAKLFKEITGGNLGRQLGIVFGGKLLSAPVIRSAITGGNAQIAGGFSSDVAKLIIKALASGGHDSP